MHSSVGSSTSLKDTMAPAISWRQTHDVLSRSQVLHSPRMTFEFCAGEVTVRIRWNQAKGDQPSSPSRSMKKMAGVSALKLSGARILPKMNVRLECRRFHGSGSRS
ncbi:hypothetical protein MHYP_G00230230 [Metynnis hypsauchen]